MFIKNLLLFFILSISAAAAVAQNNTFWKTTGNGNWTNGANWNTTIAPILTDIVIFDGNGGGGGVSGSSNAIGTAPVCIDLQGATVSIDRIVVRDGANVIFKNGKLITTLVYSALSLIHISEPTRPY